MGPDDLERVCELCFEKQSLCQPDGLKDLDSVTSSSVDVGSPWITLVRKSKVSKTLSTDTHVEKGAR